MQYVHSRKTSCPGRCYAVNMFSGKRKEYVQWRRVLVTEDFTGTKIEKRGFEFELQKLISRNVVER